MKKDNIKIKENITIIDEINAIESIVSFYFTDDEYTPYYADIAEINAIARFFLDGIEFDENDNIANIVLNDPEIYDLVLKFYFDIADTDEAKNQNKENERYINIWRRVTSHVQDMVDFEKQKRVYSNQLSNDLQLLISQQNNSLSTLNEFLNVVIDTFGNFSKLNLQELTSENVSTVIDFMSQLKDKNITETTLANALKKVANKHKVPNSKIYEEQRQRISEQQRQLISKNDEISKLKKQIKKLDAFNVQADK